MTETKREYTAEQDGAAAGTTKQNHVELTTQSIVAIAKAIISAKLGQEWLERDAFRAAVQAIYGPMRWD